MSSKPAAAPADLLRVLSHELRQPLSTIESLAYYLALILPDDPKTQAQLERIQQLVEQANWIVTSAQFLAEPLPLVPRQIDAGALLAGVDVDSIEIDPGLPPVDADAALVRGVIDHLIVLLRQFSAPAVRVSRQETEIAIELSAAATGRAENSLGPGASLSLEAARRVAAAHGGHFEAEVHPSTGIRARLFLKQAQC